MEQYVPDTQENECESGALYPTTLSFKYGDHRQTIVNIKTEWIFYWGIPHLTKTAVSLIT